MDIKFEALSPSLSGLKVGLVVRGKSGWVRFGVLEIPWTSLRERDVMRALLLSDSDSDYEHLEDDPLF